MNWTQYSKLSLTARRSVFLFCALFLAAGLTLADSEVIPIDGDDSGVIIDIADEKNMLIIGKEKENEEDAAPPKVKYTYNPDDWKPSDPEEESLLLKSIQIKDQGILVVEADTELRLAAPGNSAYSITIQKGGLLRLFTSDTTRIYSGDPWIEEPEEGWKDFKPGNVPILVDGGTIEIRGDNDTLLESKTVSIYLSANGGTVDVGDTLTFISGDVRDQTNQSGGTLIKTGEGIWEVGIVEMSGIFHVQEGVVIFNGIPLVGELRVGDKDDKDVITSTGIVTFEKDAFISKLSLYDGSVDTGNNKLTVQEGGIEGTLHAGALVVAEATGQDRALTFAGGEHEIGSITIERGAVVDLKAGTQILLGLTAHQGIQGSSEEEPAVRVQDILVQGTLRIEVADTALGELTGLSKGGSGEETIRIVLDGNTSGPSSTIGSILEIYRKPDPDGDDEDIEETAFGSDKLDIEVLAAGRIRIEKGVVFTSGDVTWTKEEGNEGEEANKIAGADLVISGVVPDGLPEHTSSVGGTYQAGTIDLGEGFLVVADEVRMETSGTIDAGVLMITSDSRLTTGGDAHFIDMQIAGTYDGGGQNLTLKTVGVIQNSGLTGGQITGVNILTVESGILFVQVFAPDTDPEEPAKPGTPVISVNEFIVGDDTHIRIIGSNGGEFGNVIEVKQGKEADMENLLHVLNSSATALYNPQWTRSEDGTSFDLDLTVYSVWDYIRAADKWNRSGSNIEYAGLLLDAFSMNEEIRSGLQGLNDQQLREIIQHLMAGELVGNAMRFAMHQPANTVFRHLDNIAPLRSPFANYGRVRGQTPRVPPREGFNLWFHSYGQMEKARGDTHTFDGYDMSRYGFFLGGDVELYNRAVAGVLFGYASPYMKNDLGKISANDYTAGVYLRMPTVWDVSLNTMVGFGSQDYNYKHPMGGARFNGSSLFASIELSRPVPVFDSTLRGTRTTGRIIPLMALDFQTAAMDGFVIGDPYFGGIRIEPESLDSTSIRLGLLGEFWRVRTRLQYTRQIAGADFVSSSTSFVWDNSVTTIPVRSVQWGKDWLNAGFGYEFLATRHWHIFTDYDFGLGNRTTSHLGSINAVLKW